MRYSPLAPRRHIPNRILRIRVRLRLEDDVYSVGLCIEPCWLVIPVPHVLRVVDNHNRRFQRHLGLDILLVSRFDGVVGSYTSTMLSNGL